MRTAVGSASTLSLSRVWKEPWRALVLGGRSLSRVMTTAPRPVAEASVAMTTAGRDCSSLAAAIRRRILVLEATIWRRAAAANSAGVVQRLLPGSWSAPKVGCRMARTQAVRGSEAVAKKSSRPARTCACARSMGFPRVTPRRAVTTACLVEGLRETVSCPSLSERW